MSGTKRLAKQYPIVKEKNIRVHYGTTDRKSPSVIYTRAKGNVKPFLEKKTYGSDIQDLKNEFKKLVRKRVNGLTRLKTDKLLCSIDISEKGLSFNKNGQMRYEIFIKPCEVKQLEYYEEDIRNLTDGINNDISTFLNNRGISSF